MKKKEEGLPNKSAPKASLQTRRRFLKRTGSASVAGVLAFNALRQNALAAGSPCEVDCVLCFSKEQVQINFRKPKPGDATLDIIDFVVVAQVTNICVCGDPDPLPDPLPDLENRCSPNMPFAGSYTQFWSVYGGVGADSDDPPDPALVVAAGSFDLRDHLVFNDANIEECNKKHIFVFRGTAEVPAGQPASVWAQIGDGFNFFKQPTMEHDTVAPLP